MTSAKPHLLGFFLIPCTPLPSVYYRPYQFVGDFQSLKRLRHVLEKVGYQGYAHAALANKIVSPAQPPLGSVPCSFNLSVKRYAFELIVEMPSISRGMATAAGHYEIIRGFTSPVEAFEEYPSVEELSFHITYWMECHKRLTDPSGDPQESLFSGRDYILLPKLSGEDGRERHSLRAVDLLYHQEAQTLKIGDTGQIMDKRTSLADTGQSLTAARNAIPALYLHSLLKAYRSHQEVQEAAGGEVDLPTLSDLMLALREYPLQYVSDFWITLQQQLPKVDLMNGDETACFTVTQVQAVVDNEEVQVLIDPNRTSYPAETLSSWAEASPEAALANHIGHAMVELTKGVLRFVKVRLTSQPTDACQPGGQDQPFYFQYIEAPMYIWSQSKEDKVATDALLLDRLYHYLLEPLLLAEGVEFDITLDYSAIGSTYIDIVLNGRQRQRFGFPSFCSVYFNPMVAPSEKHLAELSNQLIPFLEEAIK